MEYILPNSYTATNIKAKTKMATILIFNMDLMI